LNCIDNKTKYITAHLFVAERTNEKCIKFLSEIKRNCYGQILYKYYLEKHQKVDDRQLITFVCDGFENYRNAFNKLFYRVAKLQFGVPIKLQRYRVNHNNNPIERYNGKLKHRVFVFEQSPYFSSWASKHKSRVIKNPDTPRTLVRGFLTDRIKILRGGFGSFERAEAFMNLQRVVHNFVNPHQGLQGKTPAEIAEIKLDLGRSKLLSLIKYVAKNSGDD
jgi:hypothetical protein